MNCGASVFVLDKDEDLLQKLRKDVPGVTWIQVDLADWAATKEALLPLLPIHHLVNNAAIAEFQSLLELDIGHVDRSVVIK